MATSTYQQLPSYTAPVQQSALTGGYQGYDSLAAAADRERQMTMQRDAARQNAVIGGYDQQMANSRLMGQQGYDMLSANYGAVNADAAATRDRNMARIDQYGNSLRTDLNAKNQQAVAAASQSAIMRGLGNTTIQDSLVRGQTYDNNRQMLNLEDQLLQNRISTDTDLSRTYQDSLLTKAQGLASQWNQNISNDNALAGQRLGYIGGIKDNTGFNDVSNIYLQQLQTANANQQAALSRGYSNTTNYLNRPSSTRSFGPAQPIFNVSARSRDTF